MSSNRNNSYENDNTCANKEPTAMSNNPSSNSLRLVGLSLAMAGIVVSAGCATLSVLHDDDYNNSPTTTTHTVSEVLVEDQVVAFGTPAQRLPNMPSNSVVIIGEQNSYVLTRGGTEMVTLLTNLSADNIQVENDMRFYSPNNDGYFEGNMRMSYVKMQDELTRNDYEFFLQNGGTECSTSSDNRMNSQRFCFTVPIRGAVYPQVNNLTVIQSEFRALTKPYQVSIYTDTTTTEQVRNTNSSNAGEKLVMLPFAIAFDVVTLPLQVLGAIALTRY